MRPPKAIRLRTVGHNDAGDLVVNVRLRRRSRYAVRLFYRACRMRGASRGTSAFIAVRTALTPNA